ncbi:MAG: hypothetical protein KF819_08045 [Labilithrix sp.]|nr:hypothetical protein [Labilithrix sp.]
MRRRKAAFAVGVICLGASGFFACAPDRVLVGPGGECFVATDCEPGLVCVPHRNGSRSCSADLSQVEGRPPPMGPQADAAAQDADQDGEPPDDSGAQDTGVDTAAPPVDAGDG